MTAIRLSDEALEALELICDKQRFKPGEKITQNGQQQQAMYFILDGWVDIQFEEEGGGAPSLRIGERSIIGEMGYLSGKPAAATAMVVSSVSAYKLDMEALARLGSTNPEAASELSRYLVNTVDKRLQ